MIAALLGFIKRILGLIGSTDDAAGTPTIFGRLKLIGTNSDAAGTSTVFARLKQIYDNMLLRSTWTDERAATIDVINTKVGENNSDPGFATIFSRLQQLYGITNDIWVTGKIPGTVKNVQRGWVQRAIRVGEYGTHYKVDISLVALSKSNLTLNGYMHLSTKSPAFYVPIRGILAPSGMEIHVLFEYPDYQANDFITLAFTWEVTEHY